MNTPNRKNLAMIGSLCFSGVGCSMIDSLRKQSEGAFSNSTMEYLGDK